jgi:hypothetical protein
MQVKGAPAPSRWGLALAAAGDGPKFAGLEFAGLEFVGPIKRIIASKSLLRGVFASGFVPFFLYE